MNKSDSIAEIAGALAKAQAEIANASKNREAESILIPELAEILFPRVAMKGRRRSGESVLSRFMKDVVFGSSDCWYWRKVRPQGYGESYMLGERFAHRVSWRIHHGEIPGGLFVLHRCDVRNCVNPDHLFLGTKADNHRDMVEKGRQPRGFTKPNHWMRGELHPASRLTDADIVEIRKQLKQGDSGASIARRYNVSKGMIYHIAKGRAWAHVGEMA